MNIVEFLEARIAEDEAGPGAEREYAFGSLPWPDEITVSEGRYHHRGEDITDEFTEWIASHHLTDRARRVLAECQAKRAIIEHHELSDHFGTPARICLACTGGGEYNYAEASPCPTLRHLASVHADHADYRQEWKP